MLKRYKSNLALKETDYQPEIHIVESAAPNLIPFQVYQIKILHPDTWRVFINPSKPFDYYDGFVKIDRSAEKNCPDQASLSVRWAKLDKESNIDEYMSELKAQYEKKQKKNKRDQFQILSVQEIYDTPHKAYLMHSEIRANHSVYRSMGKEETICSLQLNTYCEKTNRLIIASIASTPEDFHHKEGFYQNILRSLICH